MVMANFTILDYKVAFMKPASVIVMQMTG